MTYKLHLTFESDKNISIEEVRELLETKGINYKSASKGDLTIKPVHNPKGCCGGDKSKDKPLPSVATRAVNFAKAMKEWYKLGMPRVDRTEQLRRLIICDKCDSLNSNWDCSECGCGMKFKVEMDMGKLCELKKW